MTDPEIERTVRRLRDHDYADRKTAVEALVAFGDAAVPALAAELSRTHPLAGPRALDALGKIGTPAAARAIHAALPTLDPWWWTDATRALTAAVPLPARIEDLDLLIALVKDKTLQLGPGLRAAEALAQLAADAPCPQLRAALKPLKGTFFEPTPPAYQSAWRAVDSATARWKDLPVTSAAPRHTDDLPRPSEEPDGPR